jgi:hypothetical protein
VIFVARRSTAKDDGWQHDADEQLGRVCRQLAAAARQARAGKGSGDNELEILGEEVIDLATRGLVVRFRVAAVAAQPAAKSSPGRAGSAQSDAPEVMGLALGAAETSRWPAAAIARLQASVAPLTRAIEILTPHTKESVDDLVVLREEVMDVAARLAAARARVDSEKDDGSVESPAKIARSPAP